MRRPSYLPLSLFVGFALSHTATAWAFPLPRPADVRAAQTLPFAEDRVDVDADFSAIVALSNCSGSLVRFTTSQATDKAMILTNGHCYEGGFIDPGKVITNTPSRRTFRLLKPDGSGALGTLTASEVIYATMTHTDITLYRLNTTYADIARDYKTEPLTISESRPEAGTPINIISGYWRRIFSCTIDTFIPTMREDKWTFKDSIRYSKPGCETFGGTSGSPILHADSREIIGINNTSNENGERCTLNNPCEVDAAGQVTVRKGSTYGQETYWIYSCLADGNRLDLTRQGCLLPH